MGKAREIAGERFGRLIAVKRVMVRGAKNVMWKCACDCGGSVVAAAANLGKSTKSCGCLARETASNLLRGNTRMRRHHKSQSLEYNSWCGMKQRCSNKNSPKYPIYGARGITVCDRWKNSFETFLADMGRKPSRRHSVERVDNDGNYEPDNCIWALPKVQGRNNRSNHMIEIDGQRMCIVAWLEKLGIPQWKTREMTRTRYGKPPAYATIEDALVALYHDRA